MENRKRYINFKAIGLSLIFLFNPNINIIDLLPDFIGYILLCLSLVNLADINESIAESLTSFKKMIFVDAAKIIALMWVFGISVTSEKNSSLLLWSFVFGILEMVFALPAFIKLFKGISELGFLHSNTSVISERNFKRNATDKIRGLTIGFISLKSVLSFLPEFADLTSTEYYENSGITNLYEHIGIMRFLAFVPVLVVGIIWLVKVIMYFIRISKDIPFVCAIETLYTQNVLPKKGIFIKRNVKNAILLLVIAVALTFDFRFESVNMIPDFLAGFVFIAFFALISKRTEIKKGLAISLSSVYLAISVLASYFEFDFFKDFYYGAIYRSEDAMLAYIFMVVGVCLSSAALFAVCALALNTLNQVINTHTGILLLSSSEANETQKKMAEQTRAELRRDLWYCLAATVLYIGTDIAYALLAKDYGFMFLINIVGAIIFVSTYVKAYINITDAVNIKYMLE